MKRFILLVAFVLAGCASPAKKEFDRYVAETKPLAGTSVKWSEYFEGLYARAAAANAPADVLSKMNETIYLSKQYERGEIDKDTFDYRRRAIGTEAQKNEERRVAQAQSEAADRMVAAAAIMQASTPRPLVPATQGVLAPVRGTGLVGFLQGQSTNGALRYCKYSNGVVNTINVVDLCPLDTQ